MTPLALILPCSSISAALFQSTAGLLDKLENEAGAKISVLGLDLPLREASAGTLNCKLKP